MYKKYLKIEKAIYGIEKAVTMVAFALIFFSVILQVLQRVFNLPIPDSSDVSLISQSVFTFACLGLLVYTRDHITVGVHTLIKSYQVQYVLHILKNIVVIVFALFFIYLGYDLFSYALRTGSATSALRIPLWLPYGVMFFSLIFMILHTIGEIFRINECKKNNIAFEEEDDMEEMR